MRLVSFSLPGGTPRPGLIVRDEIVDLWFNHDLGIEGGDLAGGCDGLGQGLGGISLVKE